jgi:hypothetical protein
MQMVFCLDPRDFAPRIIIFFLSPFRVLVFDFSLILFPSFYDSTIPCLLQLYHPTPLRAFITALRRRVRGDNLGESPCEKHDVTAPGAQRLTNGATQKELRENERKAKAR